MSVTIRIKRGTATQWSTLTTPLLSGEFGYDVTNKIVKIGDGTTLCSSLPTIGSGGGGPTSTEEIQDIIYNTLTNFVGINNNITVTYDDENNYIMINYEPDDTSYGFIKSTSPYELLLYESVFVKDFKISQDSADGTAQDIKIKVIYYE